jgi:hypothetical protein
VVGRVLWSPRRIVLIAKRKNLNSLAADVRLLHRGRYSLRPVHYNADMPGGSGLLQLCETLIRHVAIETERQMESRIRDDGDQLLQFLFRNQSIKRYGILYAKGPSTNATSTTADLVGHLLHLVESSLESHIIESGEQY